MKMQTPVLSKDPPIVTDHAVCRYLERAMGLNIDAVRQHIIGVCATPAAFGVRAVRAEGVKFLIEDNTIITVTPDTGHPNAERIRKLGGVSK